MFLLRKKNWCTTLSLFRKWMWWTASSFCPRTENSWCKWQSDQITRKETYKTKISLPSAMKTLIKPRFIDLSNDSVLENCLHYKIQNVNNSLNGLMWNRCPKSVYSSNKMIKIGVCSAIIAFSGFYGLEKVFHELHFLPGYFFGNGALKSCNKTSRKQFQKGKQCHQKGQKTSKSSKARTCRNSSRKRRMRIRIM